MFPNFIFYEYEIHFFSMLVSLSTNYYSQIPVFQPSIPPVSYTHLDVYKRQPHTHTRARARNGNVGSCTQVMNKQLYFLVCENNFQKENYT